MVMTAEGLSTPFHPYPPPTPPLLVMDQQLFLDKRRKGLSKEKTDRMQNEKKLENPIQKSHISS